MIDIKFLRENPDAVRENIKKKFQDSKLPLVDEVIGLDVEKRQTQQKADSLRASRNKLSKQIGALMGQGKRDEAEQVKAQVKAVRRAARGGGEGEGARRAHPQDHDDDPEHHRPERADRPRRQRKRRG